MLIMSNNSYFKRGGLSDLGRNRPFIPNQRYKVARDILNIRIASILLPPLFMYEITASLRSNEYIMQHYNISHS